MSTSAKSSITLPASELRLVTTLEERLGLKSSVEVVRRGLHLLREEIDRKALRAAYRKAACATRSGLASELEEFDQSRPRRGRPPTRRASIAPLAREV